MNRYLHVRCTVWMRPRTLLCGLRVCCWSHGIFIRHLNQIQINRAWIESSLPAWRSAYDKHDIACLLRSGGLASTINNVRDHSQATAFTSEVLSRGDPSHIASVLTSSDGAVLLRLLLSLCYQSLTKPYWLNALGPLRHTCWHTCNYTWYDNNMPSGQQHFCCSASSDQVELTW